MTSAPVVLIVEDDEILAQSLVSRLRLEGLEPVHAATCEAALVLLATRRFHAVVSDIRLPDGSGEDVFWAGTGHLAHAPTIFTTAYGDIEQAVRLVKLGAIDYLVKPYDLGALVERLKRSAARDRPYDGDVVARSRPMRAVLEHLDRLRDRTENVLFRGARDSGRQTLARRLHDASKHRRLPFVTVDGVSLTANDVDRLLFGTCLGSAPPEPGLIDAVGEGTLLITDVDAIPQDVQLRLLRFVGEHVYRPVGAHDERRFAGRLLATALDTTADLPSDRRLSRDLERRFAVHEVAVPALAERHDDVVALARAVLDEQITTFAAPVTGFSAEAEGALLDHDWPGNLRELRNRIVRATMTSAETPISAADLFPERASVGEAPEATLEAARRDAERSVIEVALAENGGRIVETAKSLGISRVTLWSKMKRFGITRE